MDSNHLDKSLLLDFYGELLTEKQREICDLHWNEDWSLAEIASQCGQTRQGVWDTLRRAEASLRSYEQKSGLVRRHMERRAQVEDIRRSLSLLLPETEESREILSRLESLI